MFNDKEYYKSLIRKYFGNIETFSKHLKQTRQAVYNNLHTGNIPAYYELIFNLAEENKELRDKLIRQGVRS